MKIGILSCGDPILCSLQKEFESLGHEVSFFSKETSFPEILSAFESNLRPDFVMLSNLDYFSQRTDGREIEEFLFQKNIPALSWHFESPLHYGGLDLLQRWNMGPLPKGVSFLVSDSGFLDFFKMRDLPVAFLPLAVDVEILNFSDFHAVPNLPVSFAGTCFFSEADIFPSTVDDIRLRYAEMFAENFMNYLQEFLNRAPQKDSVHAVKIANQVGRVFLSFLKNESLAYSSFSAARNQAFEQILSDIPKDVRGHFPLWLGHRLEILHSTCSLHTMLFRLLEEFETMKIFGSGAWNQLFPHYRDPIRRLNQAELFAMYRGSQVNFCYTKQTFRNYLHDRIPLILALGGFPLIDYRADADFMFEKKELKTYASREEALDLTRFYIRNEAARSELIRLGRERVVREHTYAHRARQILDLLPTLKLV